MRLLAACFVASTLATACAGSFGGPEPRPPVDSDVRVDPPAPPGPTAAAKPEQTAEEKLATDAEQAWVDTKIICDAVAGEVPEQQFLIQRNAANRKTGGLLLTTVVGVAGSIVTAILAGGEDTSGTDKTALVAGASTAGATALAGVFSTFVVGAGAEERVKLLAGVGAQATKAQNDVNAVCRPADPATLSPGRCIAEARVVRAACTGMITQLIYTPKNPVLIRARDGVGQ